MKRKRINGESLTFQQRNSSSLLFELSQTESIPITNDCIHVKTASKKQCKKTIEQPDHWLCSRCDTSDSIFLCINSGQCFCKKHCIQYYNESDNCHLILQMNSIDKIIYCFTCQKIVQNDNQYKSLKKIRDYITQIQNLNFDSDHEKEVYKVNQRLLNSLSINMKGTELDYDNYKTDDTTKRRSKRIQSQLIQKGVKNIILANKNQIKNKKKKKKKKKKIAYLSNAAMAKRAKEDKQKTAQVHYFTNLLLFKCFHALKNYKKSINTAVNSPSLIRKQSVDFHQNRVNAQIKAIPRLCKGRTGLRNLGNTCYMNAVLQSFSSLTEFRDYYQHIYPKLYPNTQAIIKKKLSNNQSIKFSIRKRNLKVTTIKNHQAAALSIDLSVLLRFLWNGKRIQFTPDEILKNVWSKYSRFKGFKQQDAQEFTIFLLDQLAKELTNANYPNFIEDNFIGQVLNQVECQTCFNCSQIITATSIISLQFPTLSSQKIFHLTELLDYAFKNAELLALDNQYYCNKCQTKVNAIKSQHILQLPAKYIIFHIIRTKFDLKTFKTTKDKTNLIYPLADLNLNPYLAKNTQDIDHFSNFYDLQAMVTHSGKGILEGHFTNYSWISSLGVWLNFNDTKVKIVNANQVKANEKKAYLLFYQRRT